MAATYAIVRAALVPVRASPSVRAEQVSQEALGAALEVLEQEGEWLRCRGEDGYEAWVPSGSVIICSDARDAVAWWDDAGGVPAVSLDATLVDGSGRPLVRLPWGARVALAGRAVVLPDRRRGWLAEGRLVSWTEASERFPQSGAAVAGTAREWLGVPYLWGGRTRWGADCSGLVQAVYRLHGFHLPRDSYQQAEYGEPLDVGAGLDELRPGDLLFFRAADAARVAHVALSLGGSAVLHAAEANGAVAEDDLGGDSELARSLRSRLSGARRLFR
jgi:hypothetical protein